MSIKGSDTFFPTKFRPTTANTSNFNRNQAYNQSSNSYKLVKKRSSTQQSCQNSNSQYESTNIFKKIYVEDANFNFQKDKPVGGLQTFMKQHIRKNKVPSTRKLSSRAQSPQNRKKQNDADSKPSHFLSKNQDFMQEKPEQKFYEREEVFKSHYSYNPDTDAKKTKYSNQNKGSAKSSSKLQRNTHHENWVVKQTQDFQNKMSVLNEIYYKKPLVERYGDRYFQFFLRNRHQQDFAPPTYIHQIKSQLQAKTANNDRFIVKLKKANPNVRNFQKLVVKGRHFNKVSFSSAQSNI